MMQTHANEGFEVLRRPPGTGRPIAVWAVVTAAVCTAAGSVPGAWSAVDHGSDSDAVADLLVAACASGLALALAWLWVITTVTVVGLLTGHGRTGGATRRLVLLACGAAVVAGTSVPAATAGGDGRELLVGLSLPERAVAPAQHHRTQGPPTSAAPSSATSASPPTYVVRAGDSLWSIARDHPDGDASVDRRWRAIWEANRELVGEDPDLIIPGQALRLPPTDTTHDPTSDGDR